MADYHLLPRRPEDHLPSLHSSRGARILREISLSPAIVTVRSTTIPRLLSSGSHDANADGFVALATTVQNSVSTLVRAEGSPALSVGCREAAPLSAKFPLTCDSNIHLSLFGEVITCDLKTLGPDPALIIQLLKTTQSERANYMIVGAFYRRSRLPECAKAVIEAMIQGKLTPTTACLLTPYTPELGKQGVSESELKPAYLFLAGCESDLVRLSKATKNSTATSEHYAAAQMWLQKVFGKAVPTNDHQDDRDKKFSPEDEKPKLTPRFSDNMDRLKHEIQTLRDQNADQADQLTRLRSSKRKIEEDYYYERNLRKKFQYRVESVQEMVMP